MSAYAVTVRQLGTAPLHLITIGTHSGTVAVHIARRFGACGISIKPIGR